MPVLPSSVQHPLPFPTPPAVHRQRLPNGFTTVVVEMPGLHQVQLSLLLPVGSRYETPALSGISHFVEHVLFRGNAAYPDGDALNRAFEDVGGMLNAHTGVESTEYECTVHPAHVEQALRLLGGFVQSPRFAEVEKERRILLDELSYDYNEQGRLVNLGTLASQLLWPGHPLGQSVGGVPETIAVLSATQLRDHHARYYRPERAVLALAGRVEPAAVFAATARAFGAWAATTPAPPAAPGAAASERPGPHVRTVPDADNQFHLQLSFPAPGYNAPQELALSLLARTLDDGPTSRLQRVIREERALVYHISAGYQAYWDTGSFDIATSVKADGLDDLLGQLLPLLAAFRAAGPTVDEVERARLRHLFDLDFDLDAPSAQIGRYAWPLLYSRVRDDATERAEVQALAQPALAALARSLLAPERLHAVLVGPVDAAVEARLRTALAGYR